MNLHIQDKILDKKLFYFTMGCVVIIISCFALVAWSLQYSHAEACKARNKSLDVLQAIVFVAQHDRKGRVSHDPFFKRSYKLIKEARC